MADPTARYLFDLPNENIDPWYASFDTMVSQIDTTINSVEQLAVALNRATLAVSLYPTASVTWNASSTLANFGTTGAHVMSCAPYGRLVGSFQIVASGTNAWVTLAIDHYGINTLTTFFRGVINPGSLVVATNSAWKFKHNVALAHEAVSYTAPTSLGPGTYSIELQTRGLNGVGSQYAMDTDSWLWCTVTEEHRGL